MLALAVIVVSTWDTGKALPQALLLRVGCVSGICGLGHLEPLVEAWGGGAGQFPGRTSRLSL